MIATIASMIHPQLRGGKIEGGCYELIVHVRMEQALASGDPPGFVQKTLAEHLASCVKSAGIPLNEKCWQIKFTKFAQDNFHYPEVATL